MLTDTIRVGHRVAVDWVAETFHLPQDAAAHHARVHAEARARARTMAYALNRRDAGEPRVLARWQAAIGHVAGRGRTGRAGS
jgi:hypothetical protein